MELQLEESYAMDDSCQIQYWARGHWSWGEFVTAVQDRIAREERAIPNWVIVQAPIKQVYQRAVPCRDSIVGDTRYVHSDKPGRGAIAVTVMDFWFPMHAYLPAAQQSGQGAGR
ncbi:hypothetical protein F1536_23040 [Achromobacter xylosoxidans]|uniref:hypothetical protein n=1 Tax=Alcaligenes xylosoxydans xylosoxydans TaxID=85698 RepID=UPI001231FE74|nr:hypothetical protein [Achromobacter xylosoxidans]KAA5921323.1 hypothetical protein F1536_23040 [Achromobacter xylosoxidans]